MTRRAASLLFIHGVDGLAEVCSPALRVRLLQERMGEQLSDCRTACRLALHALRDEQAAFVRGVATPELLVKARLELRSHRSLHYLKRQI